MHFRGNYPTNHHLLYRGVGGIQWPAQDTLHGTSYSFPMQVLHRHMKSAFSLHAFGAFDLRTGVTGALNVRMSA